jgi:DNA-binding LacI/PurR family transcriptional regulator
VGIDAIESEIVSLGAQYAGTIISITKPDAQMLESHIAKLSRFGKPIVYFDSTDEGGAIFAPPARPPRLMYRLHMDEHAAVRLALDALAQRGHARIGVHAWEYTDWTQRRMEIIEAIARSLPGAPAIVRSAMPAEPVWGYEGGREAAELFGAHAAVDEPRAAAAQPGSGGTAVRRRRLPRTPSLRRLLTDGKPTALLALNDHFAQQYFFWLHAMKVQVPKDISILSFDNLANAILFPLSTIDFGFSRLGYICAHLFIGDTPPPRTNAGALAGTCTLVDRGSIGAPGDGRRIRALEGGA